MCYRKKSFFVTAMLFLVSVLATSMVYAHSGGEELYKHHFISGSDPEKMVLNEEQMLTREQLALLIIEINDIPKVFFGEYKTPDYDDIWEIGDWALSYVVLCDEHGLMKGVDSKHFEPKGLVSGKQLAAVMLRALGYKDIAWDDIDGKLAELGIPIEDKPLSRGEAFDYIWKIVNMPISTDGLTLALKTGKIVPGRTELPQVEVMDEEGNAYTNFSIPYNDRWKMTPVQYFFVNDEGEYVLINSPIGSPKVFVRSYTKDWRPVKSMFMPCEGELFGGFFRGRDNYYMVYGNRNEAHDDNKVVLNLVKYDKKFNRLEALKIKNAFTALPFDAGSLKMAESGKYLTIHTARERYDGHQSQLTVVVDKKTMRVVNELGAFQSNHVSHSFDQYVFYDDSNRLILLDHGDSHPRAVVLQVMKEDGREFYMKGREMRYYDSKLEGENYFELATFPGPIGANVTGTSIGSVVSGANNYLMATNRMNYGEALQGKYIFDSFKVLDAKGGDVDFRNVYITIIDKKNFKSLTKQLTFDANQQAYYSTPKIVLLKDDRFMMLWEKKTMEKLHGYYVEKDRELQYVVMDEKGTTIAGIKTLPKHRLYELDPIYSDGKVMWMATDEGRYNSKKGDYEYTAQLYTIDVDPAWLK